MPAQELSHDAGIEIVAAAGLVTDKDSDGLASVEFVRLRLCRRNLQCKRDRGGKARDGERATEGGAR